MSNLSKTQLSFDFLKFSQKNFSELFNGLSSRDRNSFKNSQSGSELNEMFDFLCGVLGKKVVDEKKSRKSKPKSTETQGEEHSLQQTTSNLEVEQPVLNQQTTSNVSTQPTQEVSQTTEKKVAPKKVVSKKTKEHPSVSTSNE